jgi:sulfite oxidase
MEHMVIGRLTEEDQEQIDDQMEVLYETSEDPFAHEPVRHKALRVHAEQSMNAETPAHLLTKNYRTPNSLFYIRHHHPVPFLTAEQVQTYKLVIDLTGYSGKKQRQLVFTLDDLKKMPRTDVVATLQCSGNRRSGFNKYQRTSGTGWGQGALSTAKWSGVLLSTVLKEAGLDDALAAEEKDGLEHVVMHSLDGMSASVSIEKAMNPYGDCLIAYEMNDEILPRDHGYPLRVSTVYLV